jgi:large subunit ribosomal protein L25
VAEAVIAAETRTEFGKGAARRTRRAGKIPAVLYGHGTDPQHLSLPELEFKRIVREQGRNAVVTLDISGTPQLALTKTVVQHPIRPYIEHVDLLVIRRGEKVVVEVLNALEVECDVSSIPDMIEVSVEGLRIGTQIQAGALQLPANTTLHGDAELLVVNIVAAPTEADLEAELDTEGAGVVEELTDAEQAADAAAEGEGDSEAAADPES